MTNNAREAIVEVHVSDVNSGNWQADLLGSDYLVPGGSVLVDIDDRDGRCRVDVRTVLDDGSDVDQPQRECLPQRGHRGFTAITARRRGIRERRLRLVRSSRARAVIEIARALVFTYVGIYLARRRQGEMRCSPLNRLARYSGATARGIDLARPLSERNFGQILLALGRYGVLRFPDQHLDLGELKHFSEQFGEIQGPATRGRDPTQEYPEIDILSNLKEDGKYIGSPDAGQDWHTDMTYREVPGFVNVLYGIRIPHRDGKPLGGTEFSNMHAAYDELPAEIKTRLDGMTATHNIEKFWEHMRQATTARGRR